MLSDIWYCVGRMDSHLLDAILRPFKKITIAIWQRFSPMVISSTSETEIIVCHSFDFVDVVRGVGPCITHIPSVDKRFDLVQKHTRWSTGAGFPIEKAQFQAQLPSCSHTYLKLGLLGGLDICRRKRFKERMPPGNKPDITYQRNTSSIEWPSWL